MSPAEGAGAINDPSQWGTAAWTQLVAVIALVVILHVPLGNYMARAYGSSADWRLERAIYRVVGVQPGDHQRWTSI